MIDTSRSVSDRMLGSALVEVKGIFRTVGCQDGVEVLSADCQVQGPSRVTTAGQIGLRSSGGPDMGAGIEAATKLRPRPDLCIVITDGLTPWPERKVPGMRIVPLLIEPGPNLPSGTRFERP